VTTSDENVGNHVTTGGPRPFHRQEHIVGGRAQMKSMREAQFVRWRLEPSRDREFLNLSNQGSSSAVEVTVQLRRRGEPGKHAALSFDRVAPGVTVRLSRLVAHPGVPWNEVSVSWRHGGWLARKRLRRWEATGDHDPAAATRLTPRRRPASSVRVPTQRRAST